MRWVVLAVGLLAGCLPELVQHEGEHVLFEHSASLRVCAGTVPYVDALIPFLAAQMNVPVPEQIRYSWLTDADRDVLHGALTQSAGGVAIGYHAASVSEPVFEHELVHSMMGMNPSIPFLQEGLAVAYDALVNGYWYFWQPDLPDPRTIMLDEADVLNYGVAGSFVYFLLVRHGPQRFIELYTRLIAPVRLEQIERSFRKVYGVELADEVALYLAGEGLCDAGYFELLAASCPAPVHPWQGEVWTFADVLSCDAPGVVGGTPNGENYSEFRVTTLEIPRDGTYDILLTGDGEVDVFLLACFGCSWQPTQYWLQPGTNTYALPAGRYRVDVRGQAEAQPRFSVSVREAEQ